MLPHWYPKGFNDSSLASSALFESGLVSGKEIDLFSLGALIFIKS